MFKKILSFKPLDTVNPAFQLGEVQERNRLFGRVRRRLVYKPFASAFWRYLDTGEFTTGHAVEEMADAAYAKAAMAID